MRRLVLGTLLLLAGSCSAKPERTEIHLQRFFGDCGAAYGRSTDIAGAEGECGIVTTLLNRFRAENPDVDLKVNIVSWPGYAQLAAQMAARQPPDLVTMHQGQIADYQVRGLLQPMDGVLKQAGIAPSDFTAAARRGVVKNGRVWGLPYDTISGLFHVNTRLFAKAGLMRGGRPVLPTSADELLAQARRFKAATGLPYLVQSSVNDPATETRNFYTYLLAQGATIFPDARRVRLRTPEAARVLELFRTIEREGLTTLDQDNPAAIQSFLAGGGGAFPTGTWMIGPFDEEARTPGRALHGAYAVYPYPRLFGARTSFVDGHSWVMPARERTPAQEAAIARLLRFMAERDFDWGRTGHIPAMQAVVDDPRFQALPHRADIAPVASNGRQLPPYVKRQGAIEGLIGEEVAAAITGTKPIPKALADAERRVNELLASSF